MTLKKFSILKLLKITLMSLGVIFLVLILVSVLAVVDLVRSRTANTGACPEAGQAFWEESIRAHLARGDEGRSREFKLVPGASYDTSTNWWIVPFDYEYGPATALLDCTGRLEISGRSFDAHLGRLP